MTATVVPTTSPLLRAVSPNPSATTDPADPTPDSYTAVAASVQANDDAPNHGSAAPDQQLAPRVDLEPISKAIKKSPIDQLASDQIGVIAAPAVSVPTTTPTMTLVAPAPVTSPAPAPTADVDSLSLPAPVTPQPTSPVESSAPIEPLPPVELEPTAQQAPSGELPSAPVGVAPIPCIPTNSPTSSTAGQVVPSMVSSPLPLAANAVQAPQPKTTQTPVQLPAPVQASSSSTSAPATSAAATADPPVPAPTTASASPSAAIPSPTAAVTPAATAGSSAESAAVGVASNSSQSAVNPEPTEPGGSDDSSSDTPRHSPAASDSALRLAHAPAGPESGVAPSTAGLAASSSSDSIAAAVTAPPVSSPAAAATPSQAAPPTPAAAPLTDAAATVTSWTVPGAAVHGMTVQVAPHGLGNVTAHIDARGNQVTVAMTSDNEAGREALRTALPNLSEHLRSGGASQVNVTVDSAGHDATHGGSAQTTDGRRMPWSDNGSNPSSNRASTASSSTNDQNDPASPVAQPSTSPDRLLDLAL